MALPTASLGVHDALDDRLDKETEMKSISSDELKLMLDTSDGKLTLVNTLPPEHFAETRIPNSINIPQDSPDFVERVKERAGSLNQPVVVYCANKQCDSSEKAARKLDDAGFAAVYDFEGGAKDWQAAGNELVGA